MTGLQNEGDGRDLEATLVWRSSPSGGLIGTLRLVNRSDRTIRLPGKPRLAPMGPEGQPLHTETIVTLELVPPGYVDLPPGAAAESRVGWAGWDGPPAGRLLRVAWDGGSVVVEVEGPTQPPPDDATNLYSSWFTLAP